MDLLVDEEDARVKIAVEFCAEFEVKGSIAWKEEVAVDGLSDLERELQEGGFGL